MLFFKVLLGLNETTPARVLQARLATRAKVRHLFDRLNATGLGVEMAVQVGAF